MNLGLKVSFFRIPTFLLDIECASTSSDVIHKTNDTAVKSSEFPFLVALVTVSDSKFICGGSLVTTKHVLTAAHCIQPIEKKRLAVKDFILHFGPADVAVTKREVEEVFFHHRWKSGHLETDLAILLAKQPVEFSKTIKPVCLMHSPIFYDPANGTVVGSCTFKRN